MSSARLSGRVESRVVKTRQIAGSGAASASDSLAHPPLNHSELTRIAASLSIRDFHIVHDVFKLRLISSSQLQRLHFVGGTKGSNARLARLALHRLVNLRVLARLDRRIGGVRAGSAGHIYSLDSVGQFVARIQAADGRRRRPTEPGLAFADHTLAIAEFYTRLVEAGRAERLELVEFTAEPSCWRTFLGAGGARVALKPDAFVRTARGAFEDLWFVEVDRGTESATALAGKFRLYRQYWQTGREQQRWSNTFPRVLWLAPDLPRVRRLLDIAAKQPVDSWKLFSVRLFDEALHELAPKESK